MKYTYLFLWYPSFFSGPFLINELIYVFRKKNCLRLSWHALNYIFNAVRDSHQSVVLLMIFSVSSAPSSRLKTSLLMINHTSVALGRSLMCKGCYCPPLASTAEGRTESRRLKEDKTTLIFFFNFPEEQLISCIPPQRIIQMCRSLSVSAWTPAVYIH